MLLKTEGDEYEKFLAEIKKVYEKRSGKVFTRDELEEMARSLAGVGAVIHNYYSKQLGKEPRFIL